ncbi:MAG: transporter substrate-binding domain-containing protein [Pseudomonadota bacterium]
MSLRSCLALTLLLIGATSACSGESSPPASTTEASEESISAPPVTAGSAPAEAPPEPVPMSPEALAAQEMLEDLAPLNEQRFNLPWTGDLEGMEERRAIRVLTVYSVGRYYLDEAQEKGLVYEMFKEYEKYLNDQLGKKHLKVYVVFIPVARDELIPALLEGRGDVVAASLSITPERLQDIDFTRPTSKSVSEVLVTGPSAPALASITDLSGKTLFVRQSSSYRESVEELNRAFAEQGKAAVAIEPLSELLEDDDLIEMVNSGMLPWAIVDDYKTQLWDGVFNDITIRDDIVFREGGQIAWGIRKESPQFKASLDNFLKSHRQGTLFGNILINRYIRDFDWAANALADDDYGRLEELADVFRNYGEQYGIDYLMVAAQGYQESRLRQDARSAAGAVGVMQLLPSTARDPNVGISDISTVEPNIHAGVRYLDFLRERYFSDPEISDRDRTLLALAAYNAGPSRMIKMRREAENAGYDPNVWFDNVEVIAAKRIGRETVQYVANIYKYYLAYRLVAEQKLEREIARAEAGING